MLSVGMLLRNVQVPFAHIITVVVMMTVYKNNKLVSE